MNEQPLKTRGFIPYTKQLSAITWGVFTVVAVGVAAVYGLTVWVNTLVDSRVQSDEVLKKIANKIRPSVIFDEKGTILADMGGMSYLESVPHVERIVNDAANTVGYKITVSLKQFLSNTPILQVMESYGYTLNTTPGPGYQVIYEVSIGFQMITEKDGNTSIAHGVTSEDSTHLRFRLEILI